jgi:hypothetical protein
VALPGLEHKCPNTGDVDTMAACLESYIARRARYLEGRYVGAWLDGGWLYLDTVEVLEDRASAVLAGIAAEQLAIFDLAAGEEIRLDTAQVTP